jgi:molecular chaperone HscC
MSEDSGIVVGIDLGTTFSVAAHVTAAGPSVILNSTGKSLTPSVVALDNDGTMLLGAAARATAVAHPERAARCFKRDMGTDRMFSLGGRGYSPTELSAVVLRGLRRDVEASLGRKIEEAVVTVPAYFGEAQRRATRDACELAGLRVERTINEPTAAALAHGLRAGAVEERVAVLDLGGGTFDVTILELLEGVVEIQASAGDIRLGGEDFLDALTELIELEFQTVTRLDLAKSPVVRARLREASELVKCRLSHEEQVEIRLDVLPEESRVERFAMSVDRNTLERVCAPLVERLRAPVFRALRDASVAPSVIDRVLLVGGASRMPLVHHLVRDVFARSPEQSLPPDEAVALGAAIQAALKRGDNRVSDLVVTDIAPFSLGVEVTATDGPVRVGGLFSPILERGTVLPASRSSLFVPIQQQQTELVIRVFQGEHALCEHNQLIGTLRVPGIPRTANTDRSVEVRFSYDMNGVLEVDATVLATGKNHAAVFEQSHGKLSRAEIQATRERLARLKFHPREALPNTTALAKAEALYLDTVGRERALLGEQIGAFRLALETQDAEVIGAARQLLQDVVRQLRSRPHADSW